MPFLVEKIFQVSSNALPASSSAKKSPYLDQHYLYPSDLLQTELFTTCNIA